MAVNKPEQLDKVYMHFDRWAVMFEFRPFDPGDLHEVMGIVNREMKYEYSPDVYLSMHQAWPAGFILCTYYRKIAGFIMCGVTPQHALRVLLLVVRSEFKGRGIGKELMNMMILRAEARGIPKVTLEVRVSNEPAMAFYRRMGMTLAGRAKGFYRDGEDALILEKVLSS
jgi:[ribosomal protein S18]-alanine N-acetyltransferase